MTNETKPKPKNPLKPSPYGKPCPLTGRELSRSWKRHFIEGEEVRISIEAYLRLRKEIYNERNRKRYAEDPDYREKVHERNRAFTEEEKNRRNQLRREARSTPEGRAKLREYRANTPRDKRLARKKNHRDNNPISVKKAKDRLIIPRKPLTLATKYTGLLRSAKQRGIPVHLTFEEYCQVVSSGVCHYSGDPLPERGHGVDRKENARPYELSNCLPCAAWVNDLKGDKLTYEETRELVAKKLEIRRLLSPEGLPPVLKTLFYTRDSAMEMFKAPDISPRVLRVSWPWVHFENFDVYIQDLDQERLDLPPDFQGVVFRPSELIGKAEVCRSILLHKLGLSVRTHARKCEIRMVPPSEYVPFLTENHLKGPGTKSPTVGLYESGRLLMVLGYIRTNDRSVEINRCATLAGHYVAGGFSRLLSWVRDETNPMAITSFVDLRYHRGTGYLKSGFELRSTSEGWHWTDGLNTFNRTRCRSNMDFRQWPEAAYARENEWWKIYDMGIGKFVVYFDENARPPDRTKPALTLDQKRELTNKALQMARTPEVREAVALKLLSYQEGVKKSTYQNLVAQAQQADLTLLTSWEEYNSADHRHRSLMFSCSAGHEFTRSADQWQARRTCPGCQGLSNQGGAFADKLLAKGWTYLDGDYTDKHSVLTCVCVKCGQELTKAFRHFVSHPTKDHHCLRSPEVASLEAKPVETLVSDGSYLDTQRTITYNRLLTKASSMGCELITPFEGTFGNTAQIEFRCKEGHLFTRRRDQTYHTLKGCHYCRGVNFSVSDANLPVLLAERGLTYIRGTVDKAESSLITVECSAGHRITDTYKSLRRLKNPCLRCLKAAETE